MNEPIQRTLDSPLTRLYRDERHHLHVLFNGLRKRELEALADDPEDICIICREFKLWDAEGRP